MYARKDRKGSRTQVRRRIRGRLSGNASTPRLAVFRSLKHIYVQAIDDETGATIACASTREAEMRSSDAAGGNVAAAKAVGSSIANKLKDKGIEAVVFDRGGFRYHGRIKALADAAREGGLKF